MGNGLRIKFDDATLPELEEVIERGTFEVGSALTSIQLRKLYKADHKTFEDYCMKRWGFTQQHATRLIRATRIVENLQSEPIGSLPKTESQVRPLSQLPTMQQAKAWREAVNTAPNGHVTAKHVQEVVDRHKPKHRSRPGDKIKDTRVYLCLDYEDAEWSAQEIARATSGHVEFIRDLIDALETLTDDKE